MPRPRYAMSLNSSDGPLTVHLLGAIAANRVAVDPVAAMTWAQSLPEGDGRDSCASRGCQFKQRIQTHNRLGA